MLSYLQKMRFKWKLILMISIPLFSLVWFAQAEIRQASSLRNETQKILQLAELSVISSKLVHELQKERGMSAGYLSSQGKKFAAKLPKQRQETDLKAKVFNAAMASVKGRLGKDIDTLLEQSETDISSLNNLRTQITDLKITTAEEVAIYTAMNKRLIDVIAFLPRFSSKGAVNNAATAYVSFVQSKERAGIERAVLASTFARDKFMGGSFLKLNTLIVEQNTYFQVFSSLISEKQTADFDALNQASAFIEADRLRKLAIGKSDVGGFGIDPEEWFSIQTDKINLLKSFENGLSEDLTGLVLMLNRQSSEAYNNAIAAAVVVLVASLLVAFLMLKSIALQLGTDPEDLRNVTWQIANDNLDVSFGGSDKELTGVFASLRTMRDKLRDQIISERAAAAGENARIKQALDNASINMMLADRELKILYLNKAIKACLSKLHMQLSERFPGYKDENLLLHCIEAFSEEGSAAVTQVINETIAREMDFCVGEHHIRVFLSPVMSENGEKSGTVVEWQDRTEQVLTEEKIQGLINSAKTGDLSDRIDVSGMHGFFAYLGQSINELLWETDRAVSDTGMAVAAMSRGDLTSSIEGEYAGSFGRLKNDVNTTIEKLTQVVRDISHSADTVTRRSDFISEGTDKVFERMKMQAGNLEETAASMEQITSIVRQNADNALKANQLAAEASRQAKEGGEVVNNAVAAMSEITDSSNRIAAIIGVIDDIAFQTNLLALNASVEAARAGEQGRGFAVVASEVRNLAGRSANAAREIKDLITESVEKINSGSALVGNSGQTLEQIVCAVNQVVDIVDRIATASQDQSNGIEQVNSAVAQIDKMTQDNSSMIKEAAQASGAMRDQAVSLKQMVAFFETGHGKSEPKSTLKAA